MNAGNKEASFTRQNYYISTVIDTLDSPSGIVRKTTSATIVRIDISALKLKAETLIFKTSVSQ